MVSARGNLNLNRSDVQTNCVSDGCNGGSGSNSRSSGRGGGNTLSPRDLEDEQRKLALSVLEPAVAAAFEEWFRSLLPGDMHRVRPEVLERLSVHQKGGLI